MASQRPGDDMAAVASGVPRLEALRLKDLLAEVGIVALLDPDGGMDLGRATDVLVAAPRAAFARRVIADDASEAGFVPSESPLGISARMLEHVAALEECDLDDDAGEHVDALRALLHDLEVALLE